MWKRVGLWLKNYFPIFFLLSVLAVVTWRNYPWGTSLFGWDSVQPEFDFGMNFRRALTSVWVGNQGVGHIGGHGYATILIQGMIEWVMSLMVGVAQTRGVFIFSMLWLGPIGIYFLWKKWFSNTHRFISWGAMLSGLFYLLNLGTVQVFYAPLEAFTIFYGLLPWAILSIVNYLQKSSWENLVILFIVQVFFSMIGFIPPQFIAYGMMTIAILMGYLLKHKRRGEWLKAIQRVLSVGIIVLVANLYWLVPIGYYSIHGASNYVEAKNNQVSTPDFQYMSEARGKWGEATLMRGFFFDSSDSVIKGEGKFFEIFEPWNKHLQANVLWVGYGLFGMAMIGLLAMIIGRGQRSLGMVLVLILGIGWVAIAQAEEPFTTIANLIRNVPIVGQAFRAAFTKFVGLLIFVYSVGFGYGVWIFYKLLREKLVSGIVLISIGIACLCFYMWPAFGGKLIYERMKVNLPTEYNQLIQFFRGQNKQDRLTYLPSAWMWGWQVHDWGYSGSGFLWYGIEQPILDRAFDVWSPYNEGFYNEFSDALYGGETGRVRSVLDKYDVGYVLLDESVIAPGQDAKILRLEETKKIAEQLGWKQTFHEGALTVWETTPTATQSDGQAWVSAPTSYTWVDADTAKVRRDVVYEEVGTYISENSEDSENSERGIIFPFAGLMREEINGAEYADNKIMVSSEHSLTVAQGSELWVPGWKVGEIVRINYQDEEPIPAYKVNGVAGPVFRGKEKPEEGKNYIVARVSENEEWSEYRQDFRFQMLDSRVKVEVGGEPFVYDFGRSGQGTIGNCDVLSRGMAEKSGNVYIADERGAVCDYVVMSELDPRLPYVMRVRGENIEGRSVKFFLWNTGSKRNDLEYLLGKSEFDQAFTMLPWSWDGFYTLNIEARSFGQRAENRVEPVRVSYFPIEQIAKAKIESQSSDHSLVQGSELKITDVKKTGTWLYRVKAEGQGLVKLSQGYDEGWVAIQTQNSKFKVQKLNHVKVDGWANGWEVNAKLIDQNSKVIIFYWPQLLEYVGLIVLMGTGLGLLLKKRG